MKVRIRPWVKIVFFICIFVSLLYAYSRYIETKRLKVYEYSIVNSKIPNNFYGFKIVHFGDIHYKNTTGEKELSNIVNEINLLKPDVLIFTGDLFDHNINYNSKDYDTLKKYICKINVNIEKLYISGEEDNNKYYNTIFNDCGFINLDDKQELLYSNGVDAILFAGISNNNKDINKTLSSINITNDSKYNILLIHKPDSIDNIDLSKFNLILAGHSHNGQIVIPYVTNLIKDRGAVKYYKNNYKINNTDLYITSGIGTSKYKLRLFNPPSINIYRLRNK